MYKTSLIDKVLKSGETIKINIDELTNGSHQKIEVICDVCDIECSVEYISYIKSGNIGGSYLCRKCRLKKNNLEKYGVENVFQLESVKNKIKIDNIIKYGVENVSQVKEIRNKAENTMIDRFGVRFSLQNKELVDKLKKNNISKYGVENVSQLDSIKKIKSDIWDNFSLDKKGEILEKRGNTNIERYGVECIFMDIIFRNRIMFTNIERYGYYNPSISEEIKNKIRNSNIETLNNKTLSLSKDVVDIHNVLKQLSIKCEICGDISKMDRRLYYKRHEKNTLICIKCNPINRNISGKEIELMHFIRKNYDGIIIDNDRTIISPYEVDVYLPDLNLAFEFNGIYRHSELFRDKEYHSNKTKMSNNKNVQLIHIWEDDWIYRKDIVKSMIINKLHNTRNRIMSRKCEIREINDIDISRDFLNSNHIQGFVGSTSKIGLFYNNELVSLMTFKISVDGVYELNRFCNKINTIVAGGASRLFNYFLKKFECKKIISFSNNSYSNGSLYTKLGFVENKKLKPDYSYIIGDCRIHKFNFRNSNNDNNIKIYDCGKIKFEYNI